MAIEQAQKTYDTICSTLDKMGWTYDRNDEKLTITTGAMGEKMAISLMIEADAKRDILSVLSKLPFDVKEDRIIDASAVISAINFNLVEGCFDLDLSDGTVLYRAVSSFKNSDISGEVIEYLIFIVCQTVDKYNHYISELSEGRMSISDVLGVLKNE